MTENQVVIVVFLFVVICLGVTLSIDLIGIHKKLRNIERLLLNRGLSTTKQDTGDKNKVSYGESKND